MRVPGWDGMCSSTEPLQPFLDLIYGQKPSQDENVESKLMCQILVEMDCKGSCLMNCKGSCFLSELSCASPIMAACFISFSIRFIAWPKRMHSPFEKRLLYNVWVSNGNIPLDAPICDHSYLRCSLSELANGLKRCGGRRVT